MKTSSITRGRSSRFSAANYIFFAHSETSQAKGKEFLGRFMRRGEDRDPRATVAVLDAQYDAIVEWGSPTTVPSSGSPGSGPRR